MGQGHKTVYQCDGLVHKIVLAKYEVNLLSHKEIMANVKGIFL